MEEMDGRSKNISEEEMDGRSKYFSKM